jgi:hypothetical protein
MNLLKEVPGVICPTFASKKDLPKRGIPRINFSLGIPRLCHSCKDDSFKYKTVV